jgi:hypothetical protein
LTLNQQYFVADNSFPEGIIKVVEVEHCLASTILSGQRQLLFPNALVVDRSRRGCGKVGIPRGLRDFQVRWESPKDFSTERLFHSLFARDFLRATSSWLNNNLFN